LYYDVEPFLFYVMTIGDAEGCHTVGYFSKVSTLFLSLLIARPFAFCVNGIKSNEFCIKFKQHNNANIIMKYLLIFREIRYTVSKNLLLNLHDDHFVTTM